ncbi:MAG: alpha/beta fold hydrolase [Microthrixaceae bacterium]
MERRSLRLHGVEVSYRSGGSGPVVLLVHGMAGSSSSWVPVLEELGRSMTCIAPDLPGHGRSGKPRGDYSLGAQAGFLRDLLAALGHSRATVVGTSLGGGIAMQFAYQHPECCERLVLVGSGGLGEEVMPLLKVLSWPGAEFVMPVAFLPFIPRAVEGAAGLFARVGLRPDPPTREIWRAYTSLTDPETRTAFVHTLRSVVDHRGQRVSARNKLYLARAIPTLVVWGDEDPVIPVEHAHQAVDAIPGARLEIMEGCGHFPYAEQPTRFVGLLTSFVESTEPASVRSEEISALLREVVTESS